MSVLKAPPKQPETTVVQLRLDEEARTTLTKYAEYLECSPLHDVAEALKLALSDTDWAAERSEQDTTQLLTVSEVARRLGVTCNWVYTHADQLGVCRLGKYLRFSWPRVLERLQR